MQRFFKQPNFLKNLLIGISLIVLLILLSVYFIHKSSLIESEKIAEDLLAVSYNNVNQINFSFQEFSKTLMMTAQGLAEKTDIISEEYLQEYLQKMLEVGGFLCFSLDYIDGTTYVPDEHIKDTLTEDYLEKMKTNRPFISDVYYSNDHKTNAVSISVPIAGAGAEGYYLKAVLATDQLTQIFEKNFFTAGGYFHIIDNNGKSIASSNSEFTILSEEFFFDAVSQLKFTGEYSLDSFLNAFTQKTQGLLIYESGTSNRRYAFFMPVGINDWMLLSVVPEEEIIKGAIPHQINAFVLIIGIVLLLLVTFFHVFSIQQKIIRRTKTMQDALQALAEQSGKAIVEWDYTTKTLTPVSGFQNVFGRSMKLIDFSANNFTKTVHPDDREAFSEMYEKILQCENITDYIFRLKHGNGQYKWCSLSSILLRTKKNKPKKVIAFLENIDNNIRLTEELREKAESDLLTGLYNKITTEKRIEEALACEETTNAALFIIDLDNFKSINDTFGHLEGDLVLQTLATSLKNIFRADDIIGRVGGDEFVVYFSNFDRQQTVEKILKQKLQALHNNVQKTCIENSVAVTISFSIGISLFPQHGSDLKTLYEAADKALYKIKKSTKNDFKIYSPDDSQNDEE